MLKHASPIIKGRVVDTLRTRFESEVQLDSLAVEIADGIQVTGGGLRIFPKENLRNAGYNKPLIAVGHFDFRASLAGLFFKPTRVGLEGAWPVHQHAPRKLERK